jgi:DtxR family Mn-dependent transcriptional regulator
MRTHSTSNETVEMYLKTIAELSDGQSPVSIADIAGRLGVTAVSTSEMVKRLVEHGVLEHVRYKGVVLTVEGRLWECFLVDHLHLNWAGAYEASCRLEHATSVVLAEALSAYLGHPTVCPHGNPIPDPSGEVALEEVETLNNLKVGRRAHIVSIQPTTTDVYAYLQKRDLLPGREVIVRAFAPLDGPLTVDVGDKEIMLGRNMAALLHVRPVVTPVAA